jgi:dTDP-4-dehydrorhamnose reductase
MRIYVAGAGGMLGEGVRRTARPDDTLRFTDKDINSDWLEFCDFRDFEFYARDVADFRPDVLIHLGAHTSLEYCEREPDDAYRTNTLSVEHAATIANRLDIPLVYISTAGIFDGAKEMYDDWDTPAPLGVYARSKHLGELVVQTRVARHFVFRAGWMMGGGVAKDKKFIAKMARQLADGAVALDVVDDKLGTPTLTWDFARNLRAMLDTSYFGTYNMVCGGLTGRLEVAVELVRLLGLEHEVTVNPVPSSRFQTEFFAPRPANERLINRKLELRGLNMMRDWRVALADYVAGDWADHVAAARAGLNVGQHALLPMRSASQ